jgi:hypothetical protein
MTVSRSASPYLLTLTTCITMTFACSPTPDPPAASVTFSPVASTTPTTADLPALEARIKRFAPVDLTVPLEGLPAHERDALRHIVNAAKVMDGLFLEQVWAGNPGVLAELARETSPAARAELHYFLINKGPWSRLDHNEPFLRAHFAVPQKPAQANYYPADATREEVDKWIGTLKGPAHADATGFFTVIRRGAGGKLVAVPYNIAYQNALIEASRHLRQAAAATTQPTLRKFLELRAAAFLSNDYYASDVAWMELDASIEPTIGPYETYEDEWFGFKAAFEAFVTLRDDAETKKLAMFSSELQGLENALPIDQKFRNPTLGTLAPIRVVNVILSAGDGNRGVQTAAFNLPNDDRVVKEKGSKKVMLKNVQEAKFQKVLTPIAGVALPAADRARVTFEAFFTHILMHEVMHGLGPQQVAGTTQAVRLALKDTFGALEEAKADISGLWALQQLADKGVVSKAVADAMYTTFLASTFRSIRFGINEAHGKGIALQLNYLLDKGAFIVNADGTFAVDNAKIKGAVADLTRELMTIQATGDYAAAQALLKKMVVVRPPVQAVLDKLKDVPVDIEPRFVTASSLAAK